MTRALDLAESALRAAEGDEAEVLVHAERSGVARFAGSIVHQPTLIDDAQIRMRIVRDGKVGWASTNRADGLDELARRAGEAADQARPDPDFPGLAPPADYEPSPATTRRRPSSAPTTRPASPARRSPRRASSGSTATSRAR